MQIFRSFQSRMVEVVAAAALAAEDYLLEVAVCAGQDYGMDGNRIRFWSGIYC